MKFHWGYALFGVYALFVIAMIFMIYKASNVSLNLESKDYYEQDLNYQERIERKANSASLTQKLNIQYNSHEQKIEIDYPHDMQDFSGTITLFRPSDSNNDKEFEIKNPDSKKQVLDVSGLLAGMWKVKIIWESGIRKFYDEATIMIAP